MSSSNAFGLDGFDEYFYHNYRDTIASYVFNWELQFFTHKWILPDFNSNIAALIPKHLSVDKIEHFKLIAMANFQFKVITKIMVDRLALIAPKIISP